MNGPLYQKDLNMLVRSSFVRFNSIPAKHWYGLDRKYIENAELPQIMAEVEGNQEERQEDAAVQINLSDNGFRAKECRMIMKVQFTNLKALLLKQNQIGDKGCKYLSKSSWPNLTELSLGQNSIGTRGCQYLARTNWSKLQWFYLEENNVNEKGCENFLRCCWDLLEEWALTGNPIGKKGYNILEKRFRYCKIICDSVFK